MRKTMMILLLLPLMACVTGCSAGADQRTGEAEGYGGKLKVAVTMNGTDITAVKVIEHHETQGVGTRAIDALPAAIVKADSIDVEGVSGATVTSNAIKQAVTEALSLAGVMQNVIPMDETNATKAPAMTTLTGVGMASSGRKGPGTREDGSQIYSFNVVMAFGEFEENGKIRAVKVDQLEITSDDFSGFPTGEEDMTAFLEEVSAWQTKGMKGENYKMPSGSWRAQMDAYEQAMVGKTMEEVQAWHRENFDQQTGKPKTEVVSGASMALSGENGDILLALNRAWENARQSRQDATPMVDTNTVTDVTEGENNLG